MKKNLIKNTVNTSPDYYCTWQTQLYLSDNGGPHGQRKNMTEAGLFGNEKGQGWAYFYEDARQDLFLVMDDSWDVPFEDYEKYYGSLILDKGKFPESCNSNNTVKNLKNLTDKIKSLGWKGLGGWVCAQESEVYQKTSIEEYWKERLLWAKEAGFSYWKVDWGKSDSDFEFRKMLTDSGHKYAPELIIEQAKVQESIPVCDVFRTYDVPAIMSIPRTMNKCADTLMHTCEEGYKGIINCEDEVYFAAALGCAMGIMRHPMTGNLPNGEPDLSFPQMHRNLKTKIKEITRAVRWHRMAPAFGVNKEETYISDTMLCDRWQIENQLAEIETWWNFRDGDVLEDTAPSAITRGIKLPLVEADENGFIPFIVASKNPNGTVSVATLGRTNERDYFIPHCKVEIDADNSKMFGIFGEYEKLIINVSYNTRKIKLYAQDISDCECEDITELAELKDGKIIIDGALIHRLGTKMNGAGDTSEPGLVVCVEKQER